MLCVLGIEHHDEYYGAYNGDYNAGDADEHGDLTFDPGRFVVPGSREL